MVCENCGKEMVKVGTLTDEELNEFYYVNELFATVNQALNSELLKDLEFTDGQVFEYFRACYDQLAQARYLQFLFNRELKNRLKISQEISITVDGITKEVFTHPM